MASPGSTWLTPCDLQPHQDPGELLVAVGADHDDGVRLVLVRLAEVDAVDGVVAAVVQDVVEDPREHAGVHQMAGDLDGLGDLHGSRL